MIRILWMRPMACLVATTVVAASTALAADRESLPDYGVMLNDDGDMSFTDIDPERSEANLRAMVRTLEGTPVRTLVYSVATGSDILLYPSEVGSVYGWRTAGGEAKAPWNERMPIMREAVANRLDAVGTAADEAKKMGLLFVPTLRMNDAHFVHEPMENVLTGRFWIENHQRLTLGTSPMQGYDGYRELLDFSHAEVREHRLAVIQEVIRRYGGVMDGLQLDFMRHPIFFPADKAAERAPLMTELIAAIRAALDEEGEKVGRFLPLQVRVPPTLRSCRWSGLDVESWIHRRLVDVVIPSPAMTLAHDMPIDEFVAIAEGSGVAVYAAIFDRTQYDWPFTVAPTPAAHQGLVDRDVSGAQARGAARNYRAMGAAGLELYNFNLPPNAATTEVLEALGDLDAGDRIYAVTPAYWLDREDAFENRKQIPAPLALGQPSTFELFAGESPAADPNLEWFLRIGLYNLPEAPAVSLLVELNGVPLHRGPLGGDYTSIGGKPARPSKLHPPSPQGYLQLPIEDASAIRPDRNQLRLTVISGDQSNAQIVEAQLVGINDKGE